MLSVQLQDLISRTSHMEQTTGIQRLPRLPGVLEVLACIRLMALKKPLLPAICTTARYFDP